MQDDRNGDDKKCDVCRKACEENASLRDEISNLRFTLLVCGAGITVVFLLFMASR